MAGGGAEKPKPSKHEIALAEVAEKKYAVYEKLYRPLAKAKLDASTATQGKKDRAKGLAHADIMMSNAQKDKNIASAGLRGGLNLADNRVMAARADNQKTEDMVGGHAAALATRSTEYNERKGKIDHVKLGHGLASQTQASLAGQAQTATSLAIQNAQSDMVEDDALRTGLGNFAGMYAGYQGFGKDGFSQTTEPYMGGGSAFNSANSFGGLR